MMTENAPFVLIITIVFNAENCLEETIQSVISQSYTNMQYMIIDGGSTDRTIDIIKKYEDNIDYYLSEPDHGIYDAMNKGIIKANGFLPSTGFSLANGFWLNFMNAGDTFSSTDSVGHFADKFNLDMSIVYSNFIFKQKNEEVAIVQNGLFQYGLIKNICHQSVFYNTLKLKNILHFDTQYKIVADFDLLLKIYFFDKEYFSVKNENYDVKYLDGGLSSISCLDRIKERRGVFRMHLKNKPLSHFFNYLKSLYNAYQCK